MQAALPEQTEPRRRPGNPAACRADVVVEAVEIDGRKIFVAGAADPGRTVRGYANEILLGDAKASPDGRYLIEADRNLPVGDYIIRVDALEPDGVKVAARAAVPFEREPGETIAAVAPPRRKRLRPLRLGRMPGQPPSLPRQQRRRLDGSRREAAGDQQPRLLLRRKLRRLLQRRRRRKRDAAFDRSACRAEGRIASDPGASRRRTFGSRTICAHGRSSGDARS